MRFTATASAIRDALATARAATPATPTLVAYSGTLLQVDGDQLAVTGSDGETTISALASVTDPLDGQTLLLPAPLAAYLATLPASMDVTVTVAEGGDIDVAPQGRQPYRFRPISATFPTPSLGQTPWVAVDWTRFGVALKGVRTAVHRDRQGVQLASEGSRLTLYSTDDYRLHSAELPEGGFGDVVCVAALAVLDRIARHKVTHVSVDTKGRMLRCQGPDVLLSTRLLSTPFPAVETIIAQQPPLHVSLDIAATRGKLTPLAAIAEETPIICRLDGDTLELNVTNVTLGSGCESVPMDGQVTEPFTFAVTLRYLDEALASHASERVDLAFSAPLAPLFLVSSDPLSVVTVVMPVRM